MIGPPRILTIAAQATAVVHVTVARSEIQTVMGPGLEEVMSTLAAQGIPPGGPWFAHHLKMSPDNFDFELGVPVSRPVSPAGRVINSQLPATKVARTIYRGPYEGLHAAWLEFGTWIDSQKRKSGPSLWEVYLTDPAANPNPATWQTELSRPLIE